MTHDISLQTSNISKDGFFQGAVFVVLFKKKTHVGVNPKIGVGPLNHPF